MSLPGLLYNSELHTTFGGWYSIGVLWHFSFLCVGILLFSIVSRGAWVA
jgi:hypothetical protein